MEWVETTAKTLEEAKELALDRLGVAADEAEFEVLEEPRAGLFGRMRGEARVRARVMPTAVRPKQDRRRGRRDGKGKGKAAGNGGSRQRRDRDDRTSDDAATDRDDTATEQTSQDVSDDTPGGTDAGSDDASETTNRERPAGRSRQRGGKQSKQQKEQQVNTEDAGESEVSPAEVGAAAEAFMSGLVDAFGASGSTTVEIDGSDIEVKVAGSELGLLVGHGGRTLMAVQDLARVASQRRLGDHDTRLRIDVGGYREKRAEALGRFAVAVANQVVESGTPKALEPMQSADRKIVHDALAGVEGVTSRSEGDDPMRRVVISPA